MTPERWQYTWDVHEALKWALDALPPQDHYGAAHPTGMNYRHSPAICPGCARAVLETERRLLDAALHPGEPVLAAEHEQGHR